MGNEAFVAQLAQFSQVEGIKGMQGSMEELVSMVKSEQMFAGSNLVGNAAITGGIISGGDGTTSQATIDLPGGAKELLGRFMIRRLIPNFQVDSGPQAPGEVH